MAHPTIPIRNAGSTKRRWVLHTTASLGFLILYAPLMAQNSKDIDENSGSVETIPYDGGADTEDPESESYVPDDKPFWCDWRWFECEDDNQNPTPVPQKTPDSETQKALACIEYAQRLTEYYIQQRKLKAQELAKNRESEQEKLDSVSAEQRGNIADKEYFDPMEAYIKEQRKKYRSKMIEVDCEAYAG